MVQVYGVLEYFTSGIMNFAIAMFLAMFCFSATTIGLGQFHQAVASMIDTLYICYAMEKDIQGEISKPEVCHAYMLLPPSLSKNGALLAGNEA